jgi:hypothetical protein
MPDDYDDIKDAIEEQLERLANIDAAVAWSTIDDQTMMDLEEDGWDDQSAIMIADVGYETVVNGDPLVPPYFEKELKLKRSKHPKQWREHENSKGENAAYLLGGWLVKNGYQKLSTGGGKVFSEEQEIQFSFVVDEVMQENKQFKLADVGLVVEDMFGTGDYTYWGSSDGDTELWAKPARANNPKIASGKKRNRPKIAPRGKRARQPNRCAQLKRNLTRN